MLFCSPGLSTRSSTIVLSACRVPQGIPRQGLGHGLRLRSASSSSCRAASALQPSGWRSARSRPSRTCAAASSSASGSPSSSSCKPPSPTWRPSSAPRVSSSRPSRIRRTAGRPTSAPTSPWRRCTRPGPRRHPATAPSSSPARHRRRPREQGRGALPRDSPAAHLRGRDRHPQARHRPLADCRLFHHSGVRGWRHLRPACLPAMVTLAYLGQRTGT